MKVRIRDNSIRLRLMQSEVDQFKETGLVESSIQFGTDKSTILTYQLKTTDDSDVIKAEFKNNCITILVPTTMGSNWASSTEVGLSQTQAIAADELRILIEKDFQCLTDREGEDESDAFPNPNLNC